MKIAGIVLFVLGLIATIIFGIQAIQQTDTVKFLGLDIGVSSANWTPLIISAIVLVIGIVLMSVKRSGS